MDKFDAVYKEMMNEDHHGMFLPGKPIADTSKLNKYKKEGKVALVISIGYGKGWAANAPRDQLQRIFDPDMVKAIEEQDHTKVTSLAKERYGIEMTPTKLGITWLPENCKFYIIDHDGKDVIRVIGTENYLVA